MKFIDKTEICVVAGKGGNGMTSFRTARNRPKLGPDGGNGGHGGNVYCVADHDSNTLSRLRYRSTYKADDGGKGRSNNKTGKCGEHNLIAVPLGTIIYHQESGDKIGEILEPNDRLLLAQGGRRGFGNQHFILPTRQAPHTSTPGTKGERKLLRMELKLLADLGLAGLPNAGKSTLLSVISAATPRIGDYPFTTLTPQLGVVELDDSSQYGSESFVTADIPGLIEGASLGKGLGLEFLRHIERTRVVACVLDCSEISSLPPLEAFRILNKELCAYSDTVAKKPRVIILNKIDLLPDRSELAAIEEQLRNETNLVTEVISVSAATKEGISSLKRRLWHCVNEERLANEANEKNLDS